MQNHQLWLPYTQMQTCVEPFHVARTEGCKIYLENGQVIVDGLSSWWTACHGYNHPQLIQALNQQAEKMPHIMLGGLVHEGAINLSQALCQILPGTLNHCFFTESGSVAVEVASKMALQYWINLGENTRHKFIHFKHAYHGDTFMAMSLCDPEEGMHHLFKDQLIKQHMCSIPSHIDELESYEAFLAQHHHTLAGMIIEPLIQGAGGMKTHTPEILNQLVAITQRFNIPVIFDEIFTGFGRTGTMFAMDQINLAPDIVCLGKALTGGVTPLAATIAADHIYQAFLSDNPNTALMHGPTFMGHALGTQVALASLKIFEKEPRLTQAKSIESFLRESLQLNCEHPAVKEVRVCGAMGVVELHQPLSSEQLNNLKAFYLTENVWIRPFGNIIYLAPALTIDVASLSTLCQAINRSLSLL